MARITDKRLYLSEFERPKWWKPNEWVQIIIDKDGSYLSSYIVIIQKIIDLYYNVYWNSFEN